MAREEEEDEDGPQEEEEVLVSAVERVGDRGREPQEVGEGEREENDLSLSLSLSRSCHSLPGGSRSWTGIFHGASVIAARGRTERLVREQP